MGLHPQIEAALKALAEANIPAIETLSPEAAREQMDAMVKARGGEAEPIRNAEDRTIPSPGGDIPVRIYWPNADGELGAILYFHGGGHVIGSLDTHDRVARNMAAGSDAVVVSVDYRMGPEDKFPAAVDDSWAALEWLAENARSLGADPARLAVAGDSAGGNLAAVVALMARDAGGPALKFQALIYPVADYNLVGESYERYATGYGVLTAQAMQWFRDHYLGSSADADDWRASPIRAESFKDVPPALIIAAECDVLHGDGVRYADALRRDGVPTEYVQYDGMIHAFFGMAPGVDSAVAANKKVAETLREALSERQRTAGLPKQ